MWGWPQTLTGWLSSLRATREDTSWLTVADSSYIQSMDVDQMSLCCFLGQMGQKDTGQEADSKCLQDDG